MGLPGSRFLLFHRMVLLPPLVLLTITFLYSSTTLAPFSSRHTHRSFGYDPICHSCDTTSLLSLANLAKSSYIKDVVLRQNVLNVEDSRGDTFLGPFSRSGGNEVEPVGPKVTENESEKWKKREQVSHAAVTEKPRPPADTKEPVSEQLQQPVLQEVTSESKSEMQPKNDGSANDGSANGEKKSDSKAEDTAHPVQEDTQPDNRHLTSADGSGAQNTKENEDKSSTTGAEENFSPQAEKPAKNEFIQFAHDNMSAEAKRYAIGLERMMDGITVSGILKKDQRPGVDRGLILRGGAPQGTPVQQAKSCDGRRVFVYELPQRFNVDLVAQCDTLLSWLDFCDFLTNQGMGAVLPTDEVNDKGEKVLVPDGSWHLTHQYALELTFHNRLKHYRCLTTNANEADLLFVPYYGGLDVIRWHFRSNISNEQRDELSLDLENWLEGQETWKKNNGLDHVFVLGKIGWDFRRVKSNWGSRLLRLPSMSSPMKVLIERDPWHANDIGVPHPTFFHPKSDDEFRTWLEHVSKSERRHLVSFAGMPRPNMLGNVRGHLIQQCLDNPNDCLLLRCVKNLCMRPDSTMNLFLHSHFCLQPPGDSPTRRSVFDSLIGGCIPVLFDPYTAYYEYPWHLPQNGSSFSVYIPSSHVMQGNANIIEILKAISPEEREAMRTRIIQEVIPGLLYATPGTTHTDFRDAFDISIEALLNRMQNIRAKGGFR